MKTQNFGVDDDAYYGQWSVFQEKSRQLFTQANGGVEVPGIIWTSHLTEKGRVDKYLNNTQYIIQIWTTGQDELIAELLQKQYKVNNTPILYTYSFPWLTFIGSLASVAAASSIPVVVYYVFCCHNYSVLLTIYFVIH